MICTFEVTAITASERLITRTIRATTEKVAKAKMRRKFKMPIRSLQVRLAAHQEPTMPRLTGDAFDEIATKAQERA